jgi:hypothetical protein
MKAGRDAPAKIATPTRIKMSRGLRNLNANLELLLFFAPGALFGTKHTSLRRNYPEGV